MQTKYISYTQAGRPGLLRKIVAAVWAVALLGLALMFSAMLLAVILIVAVIGGAYLWWKTREFRRLMREQNFPPRSVQAESDVFKGEAYSGVVIEGEAVRVHEPDVCTNAENDPHLPEPSSFPHGSRAHSSR